MGSGALSVAIGVSEGGATFNASVAVALAKNTITGAVDAAVTESTVSSAGGATVDATSTRTVWAEAGSVAIGISITVSTVPVSIGGAGVGVVATNTVSGHTTAAVVGRVDAVGDVLVRADDTSTVEGYLIGVGVNVSLITVWS